MVDDIDGGQMLIVGLDPLVQDLGCEMFLFIGW